jgi:hypothetical protein
VDEPDGGSGGDESDRSGIPVEPERTATPAGAGDESGSADDDDLVATSAQGCPSGCSSPRADHTDASDPAPVGETPGGLQAGSRALSYVEPEAANPGPFALLVVIALGLIVGLAGALKALRGRLEEREAS